MSRLTVAALSAALVAAGISTAAASPQPPASCHHDRFGQCVVSVDQPGAAGNGGSDGQDSARAACRDALDQPIACDDPTLGYWDATLGCYLHHESPQPPASAPVWDGHTDGAIYRCTTWPQKSTGVVDLWFANAPRGPDPASVALRAEKTLSLPQPSGHRSPDESQKRDGHPYTYVNLWTWYWTEPATWKPLAATASAGGVSATVTVTPRELQFDPGDGTAPTSCIGPGRPWTEADGNDAPSQGGCGYQYRRATSSPITSVQSIVWSVRWSSSDGSSGTLPDITTSQSGPLMVLQIETVVSR